MRFTDFGSIVKTYKKNFQLRKKTFVAERKATQAKKKKDREDRIEAVKAVQPLIKIKGSASKKSNFLGDIKKFLGLMLAGFILQNLETILPILQNIIKKIGDIIKGAKEFVEGVIGGVQNFFEGLDGAKKRMEDLLSPILNADLSQFVPFQNELERVLTGVLSIAGIITGLYAAGQSDDATKRDTPLDTAGQGALTSARRRSQALQDAKKLRAEKQAQRIAARNARAAAKQKALEIAAQRASDVRVREIQKAYGQRTRVSVPKKSRVPSTPGVSTPITPGGSREVPATDRNMTDMFKDDLKNKTTREWQDIIDDPKADALKKSAARELIEENLSTARLIKDFTPEELDARAIQDQGKKVPDSQIQKLGREAQKRSQQKASPQAKAIQDFYERNTPKFKVKKFLKPEVPSTTPSPTNVNKFNQVLKNAKGFIKPSNLAKMGKFAKDFGAGVAIEFFAGWLIDRGLEALKFDEKSLLQQRLLRFNQLPIDRQKELIEKYNQSLENELNYQKQFFGIRAGIDKFLALGDMTINERKIKALTSFLTAVSISGAPSVYDLATAKLPDYLGDDVDVNLPTQAPAQPSTPKISTPSVMPALPPTGTGNPALAAAQQYGAARPGGRRHAGQDFDPADDKNSKFFSRIGGEVIYAANAGGGYGNVVDIYNAELGVTERIAEGNKIHVKKGDIVKPGTLVQSGSEMTGVFHYEIRKGRAGHSGAFEGTVDPLKFLENLKTNQNQASIRTSPSSLISSAGLDQPTTYSSEGMSVRREVNNIFVPIAA
jgi:murein DD-endopeptidase MepM/ murein hydrolase activator NlpD